MAAPRPHDLLRLTPEAQVLPSDAPSWAHACLSGLPWVVVRRAAAPAGLVPVGVRGADRAERYAMTVPDSVVEEMIAPEQLCGPQSPDDRDLPAFITLRALRPHLNRTGLSWGPTGSVGFEIATGHRTVTDDSDLDLVMRVDRMTSEVLQRLSVLHVALLSRPSRVDCQVDTPAGAVALAEIMSSSPRVMVRTSEGPRLIAAGELAR